MMDDNLTESTRFESTESKINYAFLSGTTFESNKIIEDIFITFYSIVGSTGLLFNSILMILILKSRTLSFFPYNTLLLNQLVSNMVMASISIPSTLLSLLNRSWHYGFHLCKSVSAIQGIGVAVNASAVTVIAIDRYIEMKRRHFPANGVYYSTFERMMIESLIIWTLGIIFGSPLAYYQIQQPVVVNYSIHEAGHGMVYESDESTVFYVCKEDWPTNIRPIYSIVLFILQGIVPTMALIVTSALIVNNTDQHVDYNIEQFYNQLLNRTAIRDTNITRTLVMISLSFTVLWMPLHVLNTLLDFNIIGLHNMSYEGIYLLIGIAHMIAMVSIPVNAIVYGCLTPSIRREFPLWFSRSLRHANQDAQGDEIEMVEFHQ